MDYQSIIEKGLKAGITEMELYVRDARGVVISLFHGQVDSYKIANDFGVSMRGLYQGQMGYACTENISDEAIDYAIQKLIDNAKSLTAKEVDVIFEGAREYPKLDNIMADYNDYKTEDKVSLLKSIEKSILESDPKIKDVSHCQYEEKLINTKIINSKGLNLGNTNSYISVFAGAVAEGENETSTGYSYDIKSQFAQLEAKRIISEAKNDALGELGGQPVASGVYPVIFRNDVFSDILEAFCGIFSAEKAMHNLTMLNNRLGEKVFGDNVTIIDEPMFEKAVVRRSFDDEGYPCSTTTVVEGGIFKSFLHNLKTAKYYKTASTGNGFKAGLTAPIGVLPVNLYLKPGEFTEELLFEGVEKGIYITKCAGLHAGLNPISGSFNLQSTGYLIENGKKTRPVTLIVVSGNFFEMLNNVDKIGNDLVKNFMGVGAPSVRIKGLMVSGK